MQRKPFIPFVTILLLFTLAGLGYAGWKDGRQTGDKSWTPPALPATTVITETPTPDWWGDLPVRPVIPTMPGRIVATVPVTGTASMKTFMPAPTFTPVKTMTDTPTSTPLPTGTSTQTGNAIP